MLKDFKGSTARGAGSGTVFAIVKPAITATSSMLSVEISDLTDLPCWWSESSIPLLDLGLLCKVFAFLC
jgi:hypothetical protein